MVLRRYLTSKYDWTGFAKKFYTSEIFEITAVAIVGILIGLALWIFHGSNPNMEHAYLNSVWSSHAIEIADLVMAAILTILLLSNTWRCARFIMGDMMFKVPLGIYALQAKELIIHFLTQKRFSECTDKMQWFVHLLIMTGYSTAFLLVAVFFGRWYGSHRAILGTYRLSTGCYLSMVASHASARLLCYSGHPLWCYLCLYRTSQKE